MSLIIKIFLIEDWAKEPTQIRRFAWDTGLKFAELCEKVLHLYPTLLGCDVILKWKDEEGDWIDISSDTELLDAAKAVEGHLLKLWVSTEKKPTDAKDPFGDWPRELWACHRGRGRGCRKGFPWWKEQKNTHWGYVCDGCDGAINGSRYNCRECPNYDLCQTCFDNKLHKEHSLVEIRFPKRGRRCFSKEAEKEYLEHVGEGVADLLAPLDINVEMHVEESPERPEEPEEKPKQEPEVEPEAELEPLQKPSAPEPTCPVQPNPFLAHPPAQFLPSDVMPPHPHMFYSSHHEPIFPPYVPFPGMPLAPHPHMAFYHQAPPMPPVPPVFQIPEDMSEEETGAMHILREMGFDISNSKLMESVRKNGSDVQATINEMLKN